MNFSHSKPESLFVFLVIIFLSAMAGATDSIAQEVSIAEKLKSIDSAFVAYAGNDSPGAAVGIYMDGELIYTKGFGMAQLEYDIPIRPNTIFHVASISKQFTSFAILLLEQEGKLSIDDDIRKYLPEIHDFGPTITIRHLMSHTSGFRDQWSLLAIAGWRLDDVITKEQIYRLLEAQRELNFNPGEEYFYSNSGYSMLARIVEKVSGMEFDTYVKEQILEPLGMQDTHVHDDHEMIVPGRAYSYYNSPDGYKKSVLSYANDGATSLFTTVEDLGKWMRNMFTYELSGEEVVKKLSARSRLNSGEYIDYGLGQINSTVRGHPAIGHGGSDAGFRSMIEWYPEDNSGFILLANTGNLEQSILNNIRTVLLEEKEDAEEESARPPIVEVSPNIYKKYAGEYAMNQNFKVSTIATDTAFVFETPFGPFALDAHSEYSYSAYINDAWIYLDFTDDPSVMKLKVPGATYSMHRFENTEALTQEQKSKYVGKYYNDETQTYYTVTITDDVMHINHQRTGSTELLHVGGDIFGTQKWWLDMVIFETKGNNVTGFLLGNGRVRNLKFVRVKE